MASASDNARARILIATLFLKIAAPRLAKYGIKLELDDVLDLALLATAVWHQIGPWLDARFPPQKPVGPAGDAK